MRAVPDSQTIARAIKLAEQILSEVTRPQQDWDAIQNLALSLANLARHAAREPPSPDNPRPEQAAPG